MNFDQEGYYPIRDQTEKKAEWEYVTRKEQRRAFPDYLALMTATDAAQSRSLSAFRCDDFFLDHLVQDRARLDLVSRHLADREDLKDRHLKEIDTTISYCKGKIWELDAWYLGLNRSIDQTRNLFTGKIFDLEHDKRSEENAAWRDQSSLLKDLFEAWSGYRQNATTYSFLSGKDEPTTNVPPQSDEKRVESPRL